MTDYIEIAKELRDLPHLLFVQLGLHENLVYKASDAIEQLVRKTERLERARNAAEENRERMEKLAVEMELNWHITEGQIPKWVSAEERLPDEPGLYIVYVHERDGWVRDELWPDIIPSGYVDCIFYDKWQNLWHNQPYDAYNADISKVDREHECYISHWMKLPKKPEEDCH